MPKFRRGVVRFQNEVFPEKKELFEILSQGQAPQALFITCSDARVETAMLTQSDPGELFICRNAGNIVPPHTEHTGAMTASIEFAVASLKVPHIVICGHTDCGAMKGAMHPETLVDMPHVCEWLHYADEAVQAVKTLGDDVDEDARMAILLERNVMLQLDHIKTHPAVATALAADAVTLHGWVYDIKTGEVRAFNEATNGFIPVSDFYPS